jgi:hypothetical protein
MPLTLIDREFLETPITQRNIDHQSAIMRQTVKSCSFTSDYLSIASTFDSFFKKKGEWMNSRVKKNFQLIYLPKFQFYYAVLGVPIFEFDDGSKLPV